MPTYAYACGQCNHQFDLFQSIKAGPLRKCPQCGKMSLKRLIGTGAGILFKGSGFYCTDYRSDGYKKAANGDTGGGAKDKAAEKKEAKTESKTTPAVTKTESGPAEKKKSA
jgi:putative FmdB family regulatory protein